MDNSIILNVSFVFGVLTILFLVFILKDIKKNHNIFENLEYDLVINNLKKSGRYFLLLIIFLAIAIPLHNTVGEKGDLISFGILVWIIIEIYIDYKKNIDTFKQDEKIEQGTQNYNVNLSNMLNEEFCVDSYNIIRKSKILPYIEYIIQNMDISNIILKNNKNKRKINAQELMDIDITKGNSCTIQGKLLNEYRIPLVITIDYNKYLLIIKYNVSDKGIVKKFILDLDSELITDNEESN